MSKVCPQFQGLSLGSSYLLLDLENGICLVSRLHNLRRLFPFWTEWRNQNTKFGVNVTTTLTCHEDWQLLVSEMLVCESKNVYALAPSISSLSSLLSSIAANKGENGPSTYGEDRDYVVGEVDTRHLGRMADITGLLYDRHPRKLADL